MFLEYVHNSQSIWRIWDFEENQAIEASNVIFRENENAYTANLKESKLSQLSEQDRLCLFPNMNDILDDGISDIDPSEEYDNNPINSLHPAPDIQKPEVKITSDAGSTVEAIVHLTSDATENYEGIQSMFIKHPVYS